MCDVKRLNFSCFNACYTHNFYVLHPYNQKQMFFSTKKIHFNKVEMKSYRLLGGSIGLVGSGMYSRNAHIFSKSSRNWCEKMTAEPT